MEIAGIDRVVGLVEVDKLLGLGGFVKVIFNGIGEDVGLG